MPTTGTALLFVAGGFILETAALLVWAALRLPFYRLTSTLALAMTLIYLVFDVAIYLRTRKASMDFSVMCSISPVFGSLIGFVVVGLQVYIALLR